MQGVRSDESDSFFKCVKNQATYQQEDGKIAMKNSFSGFGLDVDGELLIKEAVDYTLIKK